MSCSGSVEIDIKWTLSASAPSRRSNCANTELISGQMEPQVVKMKFRTIGRPSFISSGSEMTLPSSRTRLTAGTAYFRIDLVAPLAAGAGADTASSAAFANRPKAESRRSTTPAKAARRKGRRSET